VAAVRDRSRSHPSPHYDTSPPPWPPSSPCPHSGQVEICGLGWINIRTSESQNDAAAAKVLAAEQRRSQELIRRLALDTSPFSQAVSLIVQSAAEIKAPRPLTNLNSEICVGSTCPEDIMRAHVMAQLTDELARRAVYSSDPRLYGLAFEMCRLFCFGTGVLIAERVTVGALGRRKRRALALCLGRQQHRQDEPKPGQSPL